MSRGRTWAQIIQTWPITVTQRTETNELAIEPSSLVAIWTEADPAAIKLVISDPWSDDRIVEWLVGRGLLHAAMLPGYGEIVGIGDVRIRYDGGRVFMGLRSPQGACTVAVNGELPLSLLHEAARIVVPGSPAERAIYRDTLDVELAALIAGDAA